MPGVGNPAAVALKFMEGGVQTPAAALVRIFAGHETDGGLNTVKVNTWAASLPTPLWATKCKV